MYQGLWQANLDMCGGLILGSNQFQVTNEVPQYMLLAFKVVNSDTKIINSWLLPRSFILLHVKDKKKLNAYYIYLP